MPRSIALLFALATLSAGAQSPGPAGQNDPNQNQPGMRAPMAPQIKSTQPIPGVWLRTDADATVQTVSAGANGTELRLDHGRANVQVSQPAANAEILIDLPGGQTALIKDGLYTFNAETNTVMVLRGEAEGYPGMKTDARPFKIKEDHALVFTANTAKPMEVDPRTLRVDLLPGSARGDSYARGDAYGRSPYGYAPGYGPYGDGYYPAPYPYPYPYYAYGYPYGYGFGYPFGFGLGFGYYGGFRGGFRR